MKKVMLSLLAIAATMNVMAAINIDAKAKVTIEAGGVQSSLILIQSSDLNDGWNNGYCGEIYDLSELPLALYIQYGGKNYASFGTKDLTASDIVLAAKDNGADSYTITVSNATNTTPLKLMFGAKEIPFEDGVYVLTADELAAASKVAGLPVAPSICFNYNVLEINGHEGEALIVKKGADEIANVASLPAAYSLDLSAQSGRLVVTLNGQDYQIDANPAVTPAN